MFVKRDPGHRQEGTQIGLAGRGHAKRVYSTCTHTRTYAQVLKRELT